MTTLGPEWVRYSEKFGILKLVLFPWHYNEIHDIHSHFTWFSGFVILSVRYSGLRYSEVLLCSQLAVYVESKSFLNTSLDNSYNHWCFGLVPRPSSGSQLKMTRGEVTYKGFDRCDPWSDAKKQWASWFLRGFFHPEVVNQLMVFNFLLPEAARTRRITSSKSPHTCHFSWVLYHPGHQAETLMIAWVL